MITQCSQVWAAEVAKNPAVVLNNDLNWTTHSISSFKNFFKAMSRTD